MKTYNFEDTVLKIGDREIKPRKVDVTVHVELKTQMTEEEFRNELHKRTFKYLKSGKKKVCRRTKRKLAKIVSKFIDENYFYKVTK